MSTVDHAARHKLYDALKSSLGNEDADTMINLLPQSDWADIATKNDITAVRTEMATEFAAVRSEMANGFTAIRAEMQVMKHGLEDRMDVRFDAVDRRFEAVDKRFDSLEARFDHLGHRMIFAMIGMMTAYTGLVLAAVHGIGPF